MSIIFSILLDDDVYNRADTEAFSQKLRPNKVALLFSRLLKNTLPGSFHIKICTA
jgi:hypothetical protein